MYGCGLARVAVEHLRFLTELGGTAHAMTDTGPTSSLGPGLGQAWVVLTSATTRAVAWDDAPAKRWARQLEGELLWRVLQPAILLLDQVIISERYSSTAAALAELSGFATAVQLPHLGERFTRLTLLALGIAPPPTVWAAAARADLGKARLGPPSGDVDSVCLRSRAAIVGAFATWRAWLLVDDVDRHSGTCTSAGIVESGRTFTCGESLVAGSSLQSTLVPVHVRVDRSDHAERMALLAFLVAAVDAETSSVQANVTTQSVGTRRREWVGVMQLYSTHFPCLSCVAVMCQFVRLFPKVRLEVAFDSLVE